MERTEKVNKYLIASHLLVVLIISTLALSMLSFISDSIYLLVLLTLNTIFCIFSSIILKKINSNIVMLTLSTKLVKDFIILSVMGLFLYLDLVKEMQILVTLFMLGFIASMVIEIKNVLGKVTTNA